MDTGEIQRAIEALPASAEQEIVVWLRNRAQARKSARREQKRRARSNTTLRAAVRWTALSLLAFFALQGLLFHSGFYSHNMEPDSSAGFLEGHMTWLAATPPAARPRIYVIGDSRVAEGFSARAAVESTDARYDFWNLGVPGTTPRIWYYMLRDLVNIRVDTRVDTHRAPAAIVVGLDLYSDLDSIEKPQARVSDLTFLAGRLKLTDCFDFAASMEDQQRSSQALSGCFFRGLPLRVDIREFLQSPAARIRRARDFGIHGHGYIDGYGGKSEDLTGLSADLPHREIHFGAGAKDWQKESVTRALLPPVVPQTGDQTRYRRLWLGRILDLFAGTRTRIFFVEMPRAPLPVPDATEPARFLDQAVARRNVSAFPQDLFHDLERPEMFADGLHLNSRGRAAFSARLGQRVAAELGAGR